VYSTSSRAATTTGSVNAYTNGANRVYHFSGSGTITF
jgi:hypothetical protein